MMWKLSKWIHMGCVGLVSLAVSEGVGGEQIAELVVEARLRNAEDGN